MKPPTPPEVEFANIPNVSMRHLANEYQDVTGQILKLLRRRDEIREAVAKLGVGRYDPLSVYQVAGTWVKRHWRDGHKVIRARLSRTR